ncbi:hypothetical protein GCM10010330_63320 [Streptomyces tendae]|uniref:hypothetical protein n=1 Tax=Streptomyces tendae TaxID=1932 RepID=UPI001673C35D|nr:hypothetical protein [Streptomyces tendae]GHB00500.1 hypothetical protein GCM10010330_63320 [Streptomyces tendae]
MEPTNTTNPYADIKVYDEQGNRVCGVETCEQVHRANGFCISHNWRFRKHGDPQADKPLRSHASRNWKGEDVSYVGAHSRVKAEHGPASSWPCSCGCGRQADDWAYLGTAGEREKVSDAKGSKGFPYSPDPEDFAPLAKTCHKRFDTWQAQRRTGVPLALVIAEALAA